LRDLGIEYEEIRVPFLKRNRPEVEELSGQRWVPVLVLDGEVISDSHRILEHLDWRERQEAA
jgi:glutathione S-transferase